MKIILDLNEERISALLEQVFKSGLYGVSLTSVKKQEVPESSEPFRPRKKLPSSKPVSRTKKTPKPRKNISRFPKNLTELGVEEYLDLIPIGSTFSWGSVLGFIRKQGISSSNGALAAALNYLVKRKFLSKPKKGVYVKEAILEAKKLLQVGCSK